MRYARALVFASLFLALGANAQQSPPPKATAGPPEVGMRTGARAGTQAEEPLDIWQIDLVSGGTGFALTTPVLQGDVYVFKVWPDRATIRLPKSRIKKMVRRTKDVSDEVLWQIDLLPTGQMISRDAPVLKGTTYQFHQWTGGTLMSLRQADVRKVTRVVGLDAFKIHLQQLGTTAIGNLPMEGGGTVTTVGGPPAGSQSAPPGQAQTPSNWIYQGVPGVTDAWAPPSAVVNSPGDVPKAREPKPH
jgi:hypothetical protein